MNKNYIVIDPEILIKEKTFNFMDDSYAHGWNDAIDMVLQSEVREVAEVKHGKWIKTGWQCSGTKEFEYKCSACPKGKVAGRTWKKKTQKLPRFCEKCGAMMDLK